MTRIFLVIGMHGHYPWKRSPAAYSTLPPHAWRAFMASIRENPSWISCSMEAAGNSSVWGAAVGAGAELVVAAGPTVCP